MSKETFYDYLCNSVTQLTQVTKKKLNAFIVDKKHYNSDKEAKYS